MVDGQLAGGARRITEALYDAARHGVEIDLIGARHAAACARVSRGCAERIRVRSVVGRFLEHGRAHRFGAGDQPQVWQLERPTGMERNFFRRVETCFPVENRRLRDRLVDQRRADLADNTQAWLLGGDGRYTRARPATGEAPCGVQQALLARAAEGQG
ncbi:MAG: hypothetical protein U5K43_00405 [Halofilum sp. (in: g-proteobacteria)]|nr:hypothetical protein [Halofilum sp. (in: g-proteobacteria)]